MSIPRIRRVESKKQFEQLKDNYHIQGYEMLMDGDREALFKKKVAGSIPVHVALFLFTVGIGNLLYWLHLQNTAERVLLRLEE